MKPAVVTSVLAAPGNMATQTEPEWARLRAQAAELEQANRVKDDLVRSERAISAELERLRSHDAEVGLRIQQALLLSRPPNTAPELEIAALSVPLERIDGDFYIFLTYPDKTLDVVVGDVMGKGIPAALLGAATKSKIYKSLGYLLAGSSRGRLPEPRDIVMQAHAELVRHLIDLESFVTICYARLDLKRRLVTVVDCGHTGVLHWRAATGKCEVVHGDSLPLGIREGEIFEQVSSPFDPLDVLLLFSDGITEARNPDGELFGVGRLQAHVEANSGLDPARLVDSIRCTVSAFAGPARLADDLTSVAIRIGEGSEASARAEMELRSNLQELREVRRFVRRFCADLPDPTLAGEQVDGLELAATETLSNIMRHAYHGRTGQRIGVEAEALPNEITLTFRHVGAPFENAPLNPAPPDGTRASGLGIYMIAHSVDRVRYYHDERGQNCVSLTTCRTNGRREESNGTGNR